MREYLGIDVGGTNIKCGVVREDGEILIHEKYHTPTLRKKKSFANELVNIVGHYLDKFPRVTEVGLGLPGTLTKDRSHTIELPNIPELNDYPLLDHLHSKFPRHQFILENDANAAALGELYFGPNQLPDDFLFITLGTGVGGAIVLDGNILKGGDGNSGEFGHMVSRGGKRLEFLIGKKGFIRMAKRTIKKYGDDTLLAQADKINTQALLSAASQGDAPTKAIFHKAGLLLGEAIVSLIRVLDIKNIYIGGGISSTYEFLEPGIREGLKKTLTPYYLNDLNMQRAALENQAGVLGAAALCMAMQRFKTAQ
jgi:glucokinase